MCWFIPWRLMQRRDFRIKCGWKQAVDWLALRRCGPLKFSWFCWSKYLSILLRELVVGRYSKLLKMGISGSEKRRDRFKFICWWESRRSATEVIMTVAAQMESAFQDKTTVFENKHLNHGYCVGVKCEGSKLKNKTGEENQKFNRHHDQQLKFLLMINSLLLWRLLFALRRSLLTGNDKHDTIRHFLCRRTLLEIRALLVRYSRSLIAWLQP